MEMQEQTSKFSLFFSDLVNRGHALSFHHAESKAVELVKYGEYVYDNILLFAHKANEFGSIENEDIAEFVRAGKNVLVATGKDTSDNIRELLEKFGVEVDPKGTEIIDHFHNDAMLDSSRQHTTILASETIQSPAILGGFVGKASEHPIVYRGNGHYVAADNILAVRILRGNPTSYSYYPNKAMSDSPLRMGQDAGLVSAIQGRNNARVLVAGSLDMFSNAFFNHQVGTKTSGNRMFCDQISKWAFGEAGVLRFRNIVHHKVDGSPPDVILHEKPRPDLPVTLYPDPEITRNSLVYRIKDEIVYSMIVEELRGDGKWEPFDANDMQMEFVMLDAHVRKTMKADAATGTFVAQFTAPDNYGVFKFRVLYRRVGYSVLHAETQVSIRPFKHNEYERFIFSAYPYYSSAFSAVVAFAIFSVFFLFSSD